MLRGVRGGCRTRLLRHRARPHVSIEELGPRLAGVLIVLGDWGEAEKLTGLLPLEDSSVRLLRSELAFVRGDFDGALAEAEMALIDSSAERVHVLIRLADIALYLGDFSEAQRYGRSALDLSQHLRCQPARPLLRHRGRHRILRRRHPGRRDPIR